MRWRRRHRTGSAHPGAQTGGVGGTRTRSGQSDAHSSCTTRSLRALLAAVSERPAPWASQSQPWSPALAMASRSGVWSSSGRTPGNPPPEIGPRTQPANRSSTPSGSTKAATTATQPPARASASASGSDGELLRAAQTDPAAFAALYERYVDAIYRYCVTRVSSPADAEDATSLTFARAFVALPTYRPRPELAGEGVRSWLFTIAHNVVVSGYRSRRPTSPLADADLLVDPDPPPEEQAIAAERRDVLLGSVARLSDDQRRVVELRLAGLSGPEIAAVLGRSHGAIKMLQFRAIDRLRTLLADRLGPEPATEASHDQR